MAKLGMIDLCTSHPESWLPIIRELGHEVVCCWDSGDTRPAGYSEMFAKEHSISEAVEDVSDMLDKVDAVIIHSANWDKHVELARPFVEAGIGVFLDKPMAGNVADLDTVLDWAAEGKRITGGSSLRYAYEVQELCKKLNSNAETIHTIFAGCAVDNFNYGIHAYSLCCGLMGSGLRSVRYVGPTKQKIIELNWSGSRKAYIAIGKLDDWLPFYFTAVTEKSAQQVTIDTSKIYRAMLEKVLPYLTGETDVPPTTMNELAETELAAIAARESWHNGGAEIFLTDLACQKEGYDGKLFATEYARSRL